MRTKLNAQFKDSVTGQVAHSSPTSWLRTAIVNGFKGTSANVKAATLCLLDNTGAKKDCAPISWSGSFPSNMNSSSTSGTATIKATSSYTVGGYAIYNDDSTPAQLFSSTISSTYSVVTNQQVTVTATLSASQSSSSFSSSAGGTATINVTILLIDLLTLLTTGLSVGSTITWDAKVLVPSSLTFYSGATLVASGSSVVYTQTGLGASNVTADTTNFKDTITVSIAPANAFTFQSCYLTLNTGNMDIGVESISTAQSVPSGVTSTITITLQW
jgi:hypothetical protein